MKTTRGFTLLEMLVALSVFAVLGLMSSQMVNRVLDVHKVAIARGARCATKWVIPFLYCASARISCWN
jgi:type II secretion system protein J